MNQIAIILRKQMVKISSHIAYYYVMVGEPARSFESVKVERQKTMG